MQADSLGRINTRPVPTISAIVTQPLENQGLPAPGNYI